MRLTMLAAAALCLAAPAAAQRPDPDSIGLAALQQILANHGDVQDYTLVLAHGPLRMPAYVHRDGDAWKVRVPPEHPLADVLSIAVQWPVLASEVLQEEEDATDMGEGAEYLGTETVGGRRAHVVSAGFAETEADLPDSMRLYVDVETTQLLRLAVSAPVEPEEDGEGMPFSGDLRMRIDLSEYATRDGLTLPMRMRLHMAADLAMSDEERTAARNQMALVRAALQGTEGEEAAQMSVMLELFASMLERGEMEMAVQVEDLQVNSGPPAWLEETGQF